MKVFRIFITLAALLAAAACLSPATDMPKGDEVDPAASDTITKASCGFAGDACASDAECCSGQACQDGVCAIMTEPGATGCIGAFCLPGVGEACTADVGCKTGLACIDDSCVAVAQAGADPFVGASWNEATMLDATPEDDDDPVFNHTPAVAFTGVADAIKVIITNIVRDLPMALVGSQSDISEIKERQAAPGCSFVVNSNESVERTQLNTVYYTVAHNRKSEHALAVWHGSYAEEKDNIMMQATHYGIFARFFEPNGDLEDTEFFSLESVNDPGQHFYHPAIAMNDEGRAFVVWTKRDGMNYEIRGKSYDPTTSDGEWSHDPFQIGNAENTSRPSVAYSSEGHALVMWGSGGELRYKFIEGGTDHSEGVKTVELTGTPDLVDAVQVAGDASGNFIAVWGQNDAPPIGEMAFDRTLWWSKRAPDGTWQTPQEITRGTLYGTEGFPRNPSLAVDVLGNAIVVWSDGGTLMASPARVRAVRIKVAEDETQELPIADLYAPESDLGAALAEAHVAVHPGSGAAIAVWSAGAGDLSPSGYHAYASRFDPASRTWSAAETINASGEDAPIANISIQVESDTGFAVAVWQQNDENGNPFVWYNSFFKEE